MGSGRRRRQTVNRYYGGGMIRWPLYLIRLTLWALTWPLRRLRKTPDYIVVELRPGTPFLAPPVGFFRRLMRSKQGPSLHAVEAGLKHLATVPSVRGIVVLLRPGNFGVAKAESLHRSLLAFRNAGREVVVWTKSLDLQRLHIASAASRIVLAPGGSVGPLGMHREMRFLRGSLDALGVSLDVIGSGPHKSAYDSFTKTGPSPEALEMMNWLFDDIYGTTTSAIAKGRRTPEPRVHEWVDEGLLTDRRALEAGVVDAIAGETQLFRDLAVNTKPPRLGLWSQVGAIIAEPPLRPGRSSIGLIAVHGAIVDGPSKSAPLGLPGTGISNRTGDETVVAQCRRMAKDRRIKAVVLHIDSPGGSATASESMADALEALAERKPVVASMGAMAASGGYYVATAAQHVFTHRATLTGSIGVIMAKVVATGLLGKLKIATHDVARGGHAGIFSSARPFSEAERALLLAHMSRTYSLFTERVAAARGISLEALEVFAQGRVWTGGQARSRGLTDEIGGLHDAIAVAATLADLPPDAPLRWAGSGRWTSPAVVKEPQAEGAGEQAMRQLLGVVEATRWLSQGNPMALSEILGPDGLDGTSPPTVVHGDYETLF